MESNRQMTCECCGGMNFRQVTGGKYECVMCLQPKFIKSEYTDDEMILIQRASIARRVNKQFKLAMDDYEAVLTQNPKNIDAHWGMLLAEFGIEYVLDYDKTYKPTFHCLSAQSVQDNKYYKKAIELSSGEERAKYINDAKQIEKIRLLMLDKANLKKNYDVFICYKKNKSDNRTLTSEAAWAQDYWTELKSTGLSVFWADKEIDGEYEPNIYNAINTARFMIILCTDVDYLNSAWVLNEWTRFLRRKKEEDNTVDFCVVYEGIEPYDLPRALRENQALDHSKANCFESLKKKIIDAMKSKGNLSKIKLETIEIKGGEVARRAASVQVEQVKKSELGGTFNIGEVSLSDEAKIRGVKTAIEKGNFSYALSIINDELFPVHDSNYKVLMLKLLAETKSVDEKNFWSKKENLNSREIDKLLRCATKEFAEDFIKNWMRMVIEFDTEYMYCKYLEYLAGFDVSARDELINSAQNRALNGLDNGLIAIVERCLDKNDVDRFIEFYFSLAKNFLSKGKRDEAQQYFNKVLAIDEGHYDSLINLFRMKFFNNIPNNLAKLDGTIFDDCAHSEFENVCKYTTKQMREDYLDEIIDKLCAECQKSRSYFDKHAWYYLSLYDKSGKKIVQAINKICDVLIRLSFWELAEKYCALAITLNHSDEWMFLKLLQIKMHCRDYNQIANTGGVAIRKTDEFKQAIRLADEHKNFKMLTLLEDLAALQFKNMEEGKAVAILTPEGLESHKVDEERKIAEENQERAERKAAKKEEMRRRKRKRRDGFIGFVWFFRSVLIIPIAFLILLGVQVIGKILPSGFANWFLGALICMPLFICLPLYFINRAINDDDEYKEKFTQVFIFIALGALIVYDFFTMGVGSRIWFYIILSAAATIIMVGISIDDLEPSIVAPFSLTSYIVCHVFNNNRISGFFGGLGVFILVAIILLIGLAIGYGAAKIYDSRTYKYKKSKLCILGVVAVLLFVSLGSFPFFSPLFVKGYDWKTLQIGDTLTMGTYGENTVGKIPIEWIVLDNDGKTLRVISLHILTEKSFHGDNEGTDWESSDLRNWLNNDFYEASFSSMDKNYILEVPTTDAETNKSYDRVFLLDSMTAEYKQYLALIGYDNGWWLKKGAGQEVQCLNSDLEEFRSYITNEQGVRPMLVLDLTSQPFELPVHKNIRNFILKPIKSITERFE